MNQTTLTPVTANTACAPLHCLPPNKHSLSHDLMQSNHVYVQSIGGTLETLEALIAAINTGPNQATKHLHLQVVKTDVFPFLPKELFGFPVYEFSENGQPLYPNGTENSPIVFAINSSLTHKDQISTLVSLVLSTIYRHNNKGDSPTERWSLASSLHEESESIDRKAKSVTDKILFQAFRERSVRPVIQQFQENGYNVDIAMKYDVRATRESWLGAMRHFSMVYNTIPAVRDVVDRIVYTTFGRGSKISAPNEYVRRFTEQRHTGMDLQHIATQLMRDAMLFGTSCMVIAADTDVDVRLIRPDHLRLARVHGTPCVTDEISNQTWSLESDSVHVMRGVEQHDSLYGISILEPIVPVLCRLLVLKKAISALADPPTSLPWEEIANTGDLLLIIDSLKADTEKTLEKMFQFSISQFSLDRGDLYFPGWDLWNP